MKTGWEIVPLGEFSEIKYGYTAKADQNPIGPRFLRITDIQDGNVDWLNVPFCKIDEKDHLKHKVQMGDIVFARTGATTGKSFLIGQAPDAVCASYLIKVRPNAKLVLPNFLSIYFQTYEYWKNVVHGTEGAAQGGFNASKLAALPIPLPPLSEQKRIVAVLDEAFAGLDRARENAEANLKNARELFESYRESHLDVSKRRGWSNRTLGDLIVIKHGFAFKSAFFVDRGQYAVLTPGNYHETGGFRDRGVKQRYYSGEFPSDFLLNKGDLLVAMTEQAPGLLGSCLIVPNNDQFLHNQRLGLITPKAGVTWSAEYLAQAFNLMSFRKGLSDTCSGATVRHTSPSRILNESIPYSDNSEELKAIASELTEKEQDCQGLEVAYRTKLRNIDQLRQSLLQKAFAGELA